MSRAHKLRQFVSQRLSAVVEDILSAFEKTIAKYEEEAALSQEVIARQHALLCTLNKPLMDVPTADAFTQQLIGSKEARPVQHQNQEDPQPSHVHEEVEVELQDLDEAEIIKFTFNRRCVMGPPEDEDLTAREETGSTDSNQDVSNVLSSETEDSEDYSKDEADPRPALNRLKQKSSRRRAGRLSCRVCSQTFRLRRLLFRHVKSHLLEAGQVCGLCGERFETTDGLSLHLKTHWATRNKNPENQTKTQKERRQLHQRSNANVHEDQKPNKCDTCGKKRKHRCCPQDKNQNPEGPEGTKRKRKRRKS